jgi:regulator of sigma E protease
MSWLLAFVGFAALIILHELGHFLAAKAVGMRVERFALFFPPLVGRVRRGETEYAIGSVPLGGYVKITGMNPSEEIAPEIAHRAYFRQPVWKRVVVIVAGPVVNVVLAFAIFWAYFAFTPVPTGESTSTIARVTAEPARGELQVGDRLVAVDGVRGDPSVLRRQLATHRCRGEQVDGCRAATPATVTVVRDGREVTRQLVPVHDASEGRALIGFAFEARFADLGPTAAVGESLDTMWTVTRLTGETFARLVYDEQAREQVSGVVGNYEATRQTFEISVGRAVRLLGLISLSLGIINLFPFLPLDGGHIFWAVAEKVRGRPISFRVMERASAVGIVLVGLLFFLGLTNDLERISSGEGFGVR